MPKRSLWARQPKHERRELVKRFQFLPMSKAVEQANEFSKMGKAFSKVPRQKKIDFLLANRALAIDVFKAKTGKAGHKLSTRHLEQKLGDLGSLPSSGLDNVVAEMVDKLLDKERKARKQKIYINSKEYLKNRGFNVTDDVLESALREYFENKKLSMGGALNLLELEKLYVRFKKQKTELDQLINFHIKNLTASVVFGLRLTKAQRKRSKKVVSSRIHGFLENLQNSYNTSTQTPEEKNEFVKQSVKRFTEEIREELLKEFTQKSKTIVVDRTQPESVKSGTRAKRMAAYVPRETTSRQRQTDLTVQKGFSKGAKKQFDSVNYSLSEIGKDNPQTANAFLELLNQRRLSRGSIVNLYISGPLTLKIFLKAILDPDFERNFGRAYIDSMARGMSFIGNSGKLIPRAIKAFQSPKARELFDFLERKGLLETHHGGGKVVYLRRRLEN